MKKLLFTGASSFTGYWFVQELVQAGWEVTATFQKGADEYTGMHRVRVERLKGLVHPLYNCSFGSDAFLEAIQKEAEWDVFCHHGHFTSDYKNLDFDPFVALHNNSRSLIEVIQLLKERGLKKMILTGSTAENTYSPYGISKKMTCHLFEEQAKKLGVPFHKVVIPNPFGPYEEKRLTSLLVESWEKGELLTVEKPNYIRDNIPVTLLAKAFVDFVEKGTERVFAPSGFVESNKTFVERFQREMSHRLGMECPVNFVREHSYDEPRVNINEDLIHFEDYGLNEPDFWDQLAKYYQDEICRRSDHHAHC